MQKQLLLEEKEKGMWGKGALEIRGEKTDTWGGGKEYDGRERIGQDRMGWDDRERRGVTRQDGMGQDEEWRSRVSWGITQWGKTGKVVRKYDDRCKKGIEEVNLGKYLWEEM